MTALCVRPAVLPVSSCRTWSHPLFLRTNEYAVNVWLSGQAEEWVVGGSQTEGWSQAFLQATPESPPLQLECGPRNALCADVSLGVESESALKVTAQG